MPDFSDNLNIDPVTTINFENDPPQTFLENEGEPLKIWKRWLEEVKIHFQLIEMSNPGRIVTDPLKNTLLKKLLGPEK